MTDPMAPGRFYHPDDHVVLEVDIEDCPVADVPLTEIFDTVNAVLLNDYLTELKTYIVQQLEDTIWLDDRSTTPLFDAGFATFHRKTDGTVQSLRKPALQRLIEQAIRSRPDAANPVRVQSLPHPQARLCLRYCPQHLRGTNSQYPSQISRCLRRLGQYHPGLLLRVCTRRVDRCRRTRLCLIHHCLRARSLYSRELPSERQPYPFVCRSTPSRRFHSIRPAFCPKRSSTGAAPYHDHARATLT